MDEITAMCLSEIKAQENYSKDSRRKIHRRTTRTIKSLIREAKRQGNIELELLFKHCLRVYRTGYDL